MKHSPQELEKFIHQTLRSLPERPAPRSLEARVLAAIEARVSLPWWRQSFVHWPMAARVVFILAGAALVKLAIMASVWVMAGFNPAVYKQAFSARVVWLENLNTAARTLADYAMAVFHNIPPLWLYASLAGLAVTYVMLFGIGAAAYRTLFANRDV